MIRRLRWKFIAVCMLSVFAVMTSVVLLINGLNMQRTDGMLDRQLRAISENKGRFPRAEWADMGESPPDGDRRGDTPPPFDSAEAQFTTRHFSVLLGEDGEPVEANTESIAAVTEDEAIEFAQAVSQKRNAVGWYRVYKYRVTQTDDGILVTFLDASQIQSAQRQLLFISLIVGFLSCAAVFLLVLLFSKRAIRPIAESFERQKQFITDAGHELKTPLTIISANCEILEINRGENEWLTSIRKQTERMRKLINSLVMLSRMDEERPQIANARFSLSDAVYDTATAFTTPAQRAGKRLSVRVEPGCDLVGDEASIRQLVSILLDNAVKYCDPGGDIAVELCLRKSPFLSVENACRDVADLKLDRLFDRFYRADPARTGGGSYGLGLPIARSIAEAHHASLRAEVAGPGRIRMRAKF